MKNAILSHFITECPWRDTLYWYDTVDSTNTRAKNLAKTGAPHGTVIIAGAQSGGRGRMGRSFSSPESMGLYLSVILRPGCPADRLMHLTCAAGVAARNAVKQATGLSPDIKWANDLVCGKKKLGGILTELGFAGSTVDYAIIGIGINCLQQSEDFPAELQGLATSITEQTGTPCPPARLAAALVEQLFKMDQSLFTQKTLWMQDYRRHCITLGKEISVVQGDTVRRGIALNIDDDGGLSVAFSDGSTQTVSSGEVSIRGMYGYV